MAFFVCTVRTNGRPQLKLPLNYVDHRNRWVARDRAADVAVDASTTVRVELMWGGERRAHFSSFTRQDVEGSPRAAGLYAVFASHDFDDSSLVVHVIRARDDPETMVELSIKDELFRCIAMRDSWGV